MSIVLFYINVLHNVKQAKAKISSSSSSIINNNKGLLSHLEGFNYRSTKLYGAWVMIPF